MPADMRVVCPQDGKKMHLKQDRMVCWKRWAAKHVCEELKAAKAHQRVVDGFASQHAEEAGRRGIMGAGENVRRWVDAKKWRGCDNEEGTKQHRLYHCSS